MASISKTQRAMSARGGTTDGYINHASPTRSLTQLWPALVSSDTIKIERQATKTSSTLEQFLRSRGGHVTTLPLKLYRANMYEGKNRRLDNSDWVPGDEQLWSDLQGADVVRRGVRSVVNDFLKDIETSPTSAKSMEKSDISKITAQKWRPTGTFLQNPITDYQLKDPSRRALEILRLVARKYAQVLGADLKRSNKELVLLDEDPPDTLSGAPTWLGGTRERTFTGRWLALAAAPVPFVTDPKVYARQLLDAGRPYGLPMGLFCAPSLSYRHGPLRKPVDLWYFRGPGAGYVSMFRAVGLYGRSRNVYPAPYAVNFLLSQVYKLMSLARQRILGLWHTDAFIAKYTHALQQQGKYAYAGDFNAMDHAISPTIVRIVFEELAAVGIAPWVTKCFAELYQHMGVALPHLYGDTSFISLLTGFARPWVSGLKTTSEVDTIYGIAVVLTALERQIPSVVDDWLNGRFVILQQGDDCLFTSDSKLDPEAFSKDAMDGWSASIDLASDATFLKWMLPVGGTVPKRCRLISRFIQQTFYNEDTYTGGKGGDKPDGLMRLGLLARLQGIPENPQFSAWWPKVAEITHQLGYVRRSTDSQKRQLDAGKFSLTSSDVSEILKYSSGNPEFFQDLYERAKYEPSAAIVTGLLSQLGVGPQDALQARKERAFLYDQWTHPTSPEARRELTGIIRSMVS